MAQAAKVSSVEAIQEFRAHLATFGQEAREALDAADMEIHRTFDWLHDQLKRWQKEVELRERKVAEAKIELNRKKIERVFGRKPDYTEQEENLRKAQQRLRLAEDKVASCRRWQPALQHAVTEYHGPARQLAGIIDTQHKQALALLASKIEALDQYLKLIAPSTGPSLGKEALGGHAEAMPEVTETATEAPPCPA
jgi:DNA repair exonuclease SbcCD ATPase subunit